MTHPINLPLRLLAQELQAAAITGDELVLRAMCIEARNRIVEMLKAPSLAGVAHELPTMHLPPLVGGGDEFFGVGGAARGSGVVRQANPTGLEGLPESWTPQVQTLPNSTPRGGEQ